MGMFDYIRCKRPLPGTPPSFVDADTDFQTKSIGNEMHSYEITADGRMVMTRGWLAEPEPVEFPEFNGAVVFYDNNMSQCGGGCVYTRDGADFEHVEYTAMFVRGRLVDLVESKRDVEPALPTARAEAFLPPPPTQEEKSVMRAQEAESLTGRVMWHSNWRGEGEEVRVVADGAAEWCVIKPNGRLELVNRLNRNRLLFASEADAQAALARKANDGSVERKKEYDEYAAKWRAERGL